MGIKGLDHPCTLYLLHVSSAVFYLSLIYVCTQYIRMIWLSSLSSFLDLQLSPLLAWVMAIPLA